MNHPELNTSGSATLSDTSSKKLSLTSCTNKAPDSGIILSEVLVLPEPKKQEEEVLIAMPFVSWN